MNRQTKLEKKKNQRKSNDSLQGFVILLSIYFVTVFLRMREQMSETETIDFELLHSVNRTKI